jgi:hypothetical protein
MPWMSSNLNFLLASPLASVRCNSLGSRLSPWQVLLATVAFVPSISDALAYSGIPGPSERCGGYHQTKTVMKSPSKVLPPSSQPLHRICQTFKKTQRLRVRFRSANLSSISAISGSLIRFGGPFVIMLSFLKVFFCCLKM